MKVYRIFSKTFKFFKTSNNNGEGYYTELSSAKKALAQYKAKRYLKKYDFVIFEYTLTNEREIN